MTDFIDLAAIDPRLEFLAGPLTVPTGTAYDTFLSSMAEAARRKWLVEGWHWLNFSQYGARFYEEYFRTGNIAMRDAARLLVENELSATTSSLPQGAQAHWHPPSIFNAAIGLPPVGDHGGALPPWGTSEWRMHAIYAVENPGGAWATDARDICAAYTAAAAKVWIGAAGPREKSQPLLAALCSIILGDSQRVVEVHDWREQRTIDSIARETVTAICNVPKPWYWGNEGVQGTYFASHKFGLVSEAFTMMMRWWGSSDPLYPVMRQCIIDLTNQLESDHNGIHYFGPGVRQEGVGFAYPPFGQGPGHDYYFYNNPANYGLNGSHRGTLQYLGGHQPLGYARRYLFTGEPVWRTHTNELIQSMVDRAAASGGGGNAFWSPREWGEMIRTTYQGIAMLDLTGEDPGGGNGGGEPPPTTSNRRGLFGWELGGHEGQGTLGTVQTTEKRSGTYALRLDSVASPGRYTLLSDTSTPHAINDPRMFLAIGLRVHVVSNPSAATIFDVAALDDGAKGRGVALQLAVATSGAISVRLYNYAGAAQIGISEVLTPDDWDVHSIGADLAGQHATYFHDGVSVVDQSSVNLGTGNLTRASLFEPPTTNGLSVQVFFDDVRPDGNIHPAHTGKIIQRSYVAGTPTDNAFTKVGGANIQNVCAETPFSATNHAKSTAASQAQTGAIADVASGTDPIDANDLPLAAQIVVVAKEIPA